MRQEPALSWALLDQGEAPAPENPPWYFAAWEQEHYQRLRSAFARCRFLMGRFLVRQGLSRISGGSIFPDQWRFLRTHHGRPILDPACGRDFSFSLSHSGQLVVAALAKNCRIGVDAEQIQGHNLDISVALSRQEQQYLSRIDPAARSLASLRIWTIKEAVAKLVGLGLSLKLTSFSVLPDSGFLHVRFDPIFPFSFKGLRMVSVRVSCGGSCYVLSLATARQVETGKKKGITPPLIRIPVRETVLHLEDGQMQRGSGYVDTVTGNRPGTWNSMPVRLPHANVCQPADKVNGKTGCIPPQLSL